MRPNISRKDRRTAPKRYQDQQKTAEKIRQRNTCGTPSGSCVPCASAFSCSILVRLNRLDENMIKSYNIIFFRLKSDFLYLQFVDLLWLCLEDQASLRDATEAQPGILHGRSAASGGTHIVYFTHASQTTKQKQQNKNNKTTKQNKTKQNKTKYPILSQTIPHTLLAHFCSISSNLFHIPYTHTIIQKLSKIP